MPVDKIPTDYDPCGDDGFCGPDPREFRGPDRSDEIRVLVLRQRINKFCQRLDKKLGDAAKVAGQSGSTWDNAYAFVLDEIHGQARKIFSGEEDEPVVLD